ncbi:hypothetical protein ACQP2K_30695 [Microbispora siamensis]
MSLINGHTPSGVRDRFVEAVEEAGFSAPDTLQRGDWTALWNCTDILPRQACELLDIPQGSTYAQAVRSLTA